MTDTSAHAAFRRAAEAEGGMPVSAGARVAHIRTSAVIRIEFDLSGVPEDKLQSVLDEIRDVVNRASDRSSPSVPSTSG